MRRRRFAPALWLGLLGLGAAPGCQTERAGQIENLFAPAAVTFSLDGRMLGMFRTRTGTIRFTGPRSESIYQQFERLVVTGETPCGPRPLRWPGQWTAHAELRSERFTVSVQRSYHRLFVDNRGRGASELRYGQLTLPVAANALSAHEVLVKGCREPVPLRLGDTLLGEVAPDRPRQYGFLIDPGASRCYRQREVGYGPMAGLVPAETDRLSRRRLHPLGKIIDHVLELAPSSVQVWGPARFPPLSATRHEILEEPCPAPAP